MMLKHKWAWNVVLLVALVLLLPQCQHKMKTTEEKTPEMTEEQRQLMEQERERKAFEETLTAKKYPGIEGEVMESKSLKDINFEFDKYDLTPEARAILAENAKVLRAHPNLNVQIEGHCDERGSNEYNLALGEKRAMSAKLYLIKLGVKAGMLSTITYGEEMPLDSRHNEEAWAKNRRDHFVILSR